MTIIYHHTDVNGLIGIISNKSLWATDIHFLNDYEELESGLKSLHKSCIEIKNIDYKNQSEEVVKGFKNIINLIENLLIDNLRRRNLFIVSLTESRDNLRHWMSYGCANASYSIGFKKDYLNSLEFDTNYAKDFVFKLNNVSYKPLDIHDYFNIDKLLNLSGKNLTKEYRENELLNIINILLDNLCSIKNSDFSDENEIRMILKDRIVDTISKEMKFRTQSGVITPYVEIPIDLNSIEEIIIGPNLMPELAKTGLEKFLKKHNVNCRIEFTKCTLRQFKTA